jgi:hypothetical protein
MSSDDNTDGSGFQLAPGFGMAIGLPVGTVLGILTDNLGLWLGLGLLFGVTIEGMAASRGRSESD